MDEVIKKIMKKKQKNEFLKVATELLNNSLPSGYVTTLDLKNELRIRYPKRKWFQSDVSDLMDEAYQKGTINNLSYYDNGTYREYFVPNRVNVRVAVPFAPTPTNYTSRKNIVKQIKKSKGQFFTVTFEKQDGSIRHLNGKVSKENFMNELGYINVKESNGNIRLVNPRTIKQLSLTGKTYIVK